MNAPQSPLSLPAIGEPFAGGFYAGQLRIGAQAFALVRAPKAAGQHDDVAWHDNLANIPGAQAWNDGLANTRAMAEAGSGVAQWALAQTIEGYSDWYIPAMDELEVLYRNLKPTTEENSLYGRSGLNASAVPPTYPYTPDLPVQTSAPSFQEGGAEAFDDVWYWSSTQHPRNDAYAWCQGFDNGGQYGNVKYGELRVVLVRRVAI